MYFENTKQYEKEKVNKKETNRLLGMKNDELKIGSMRDELSR
jgi:hypothetical protein